MRRLLRRRPSAAMVVALFALVVAASGSAVAASRLVKGDSLIAKRSLSGNRLKNHTVTGKQIKISSLGTVPHASLADSATNATNAASASISKLTYVSTTVPASNGGANGVDVTATCPAGTSVTGGGTSVSNNSQGYVNATYPDGTTGWTGVIFFSGPGSTGTTYAICAPAAATAP